MENLEGGNKDKDIRAKSLEIKLKRMDAAKQDIYYEALMRRRKELWEKGERNVPIDEREKILERVKSGEIKAEEVKKPKTPRRMGNVVEGQLERSRKNAGWVAGIEKSLPKGDRD